MHHQLFSKLQRVNYWMLFTSFLICGRRYASSSTTVSPPCHSVGNSSSSCNVTCIPCHYSYTAYTASKSGDRDVQAYSIDCATHFLAGKATEAVNITVDYQNIISLLALQMCVARGLALSTTNSTVYFQASNSTITHLCYAPFTPATHTRSPSPYVLKWGAAITCLLGIAISIK
uniref:Minor glycoprotein n=1 Tax=Kibale red colobus virus 1 TaxID=1885929 RepID=X2D5T2_9NIDO|nr:minor glycoprotein [Kibale red colobus virus 1]